MLGLNPRSFLRTKTNICTLSQKNPATNVSRMLLYVRHIGPSQWHKTTFLHTAATIMIVFLTILKIHFQPIELSRNLTDERRKRPAQRPKSTTGVQDVYITRASSFPASCKRVQKLIESDSTGSQAIVLHGMGAAITRCCDVALTVCQPYDGRVTMSIETTSINVIDDFEPLTEVCLSFPVLSNAFSNYYYFPTFPQKFCLCDSMCNLSDICILTEPTGGHA